MEYRLGVGQGTPLHFLHPHAFMLSVKGWFDEQTRAKVHILPNPLGEKNDLLNYIPASSLPETYGGQLSWVYADSPLLDQPEIELLRSAGMSAEEKFVSGPIALKQTQAGWKLERFGK